MLYRFWWMFLITELGNLEGLLRHGFGICYLLLVQENKPKQIARILTDDGLAVTVSYISVVTFIIIITGGYSYFTF